MTAPVKAVSDRFLHVSIRYRLVIYVLLGLLPMLLASLYFSQQVYQSRREQVLLGHMAAAQATAGAVRQFIEGIADAHEIISATIVRQDMTRQEMTAYLAAARSELPILETIAFALPSGDIVAGQPQRIMGVNVSSRPYFREIALGRSWTVSELLAGPLAGELAFVVAHRIERDGRFAGVLMSAISPAALQRFVSTRAKPAIGYSILDSSGRIIVTTVLPERLIPEHNNRSWLPSVREALGGKPVFAEPFLDRADGVQRMGAFVPVPGIGWVVNVLEPVSTAMAPVREAASGNLLLHLIITPFLLAVAWIVGSRIARPIRSLAQKAHAVAQGDFSQRMETPDRAEMGALAEAFNSMTAELERFSIEQEETREHALFLADVGELLASTLDPAVMLESVAKKTVEFLGDIAVITRLQPDGTFSPVAVHARDPEAIRKVQQLAEEHLLRTRPGTAAQAVVQQAVALDKTIFVPWVSELPTPEMRYYLEQVNAISTIAVPMKVRGETMGALSISSTQNPLAEEHVPIAEELARRVGIALENIRLYEDALRRAEFQRSLAELAGAVSSTLEPRTVLSAICNRTMSALQADGVYIWVLQQEFDRLFGAAACGFGSERFIGMALPLAEKSTAVQAVTRREGFYMHDMPSPQADFLTQKFQMQSAIFQPLISAGTPLGVMVITDTRDPKRFDDESLQRAGVLAGYASTALANARAYQRERRIAETLQRSLLADIPEMVDHFELAHFYTPAREEAMIGGDFYDFIEIADGTHGLVVGDVSGKGLEAAVVTAMAKYVLRAYTAENPDPAAVMERTNNAVTRYAQNELFITLVYGLFDTPSGKFKYSSAGHEPILLYRAGENKVSYETPTGMAAGLLSDEKYLPDELTLSPGDMLVLYTDGLTDARSPDGKFLGQEGLARLVVELAGGAAREFLRTLMDRVVNYTGGEFRDDVAILVVRAAQD
ncbi:MAG TPA: SpoIIE family protein phosphatase [Armatimonadota bacterium]|nr:SpoIIE family protein phosphatase [Armatimonadota bacterium]